MGILLIYEKLLLSSHSYSYTKFTLDFLYNFLIAFLKENLRGQNQTRNIIKASFDLIQVLLSVHKNNCLVFVLNFLNDFLLFLSQFVLLLFGLVFLLHFLMLLIFLLVFFGQLENLFGLQILFEVFSDGLQNEIQIVYQTSLEFFGFDLEILEVLLESLVRIVDYLSFVSLNHKGKISSEDEVLDELQHGVVLHHSFNAKSLTDFSLDVFGRVLHEDRIIWIRFGHFPLARLESSNHVSGNHNGFLAGLDLFSGQGVDFSLVHSQLANINVQEEDICALHARVEHLSH